MNAPPLHTDPSGRLLKSKLIETTVEMRSTVPNSWWLSGITGLILIAALPVAGHLIRGESEGQCAWDGLEIPSVYRVRVVEETGITYTFCCLQCAESWIERRGVKPANVFVTDETSGAEIEAASASYVRSTVSTNAVTGDRRHVFRRVEDALKHVEAANGLLLLGADRPFADTSATE